MVKVLKDNDALKQRLAQYELAPKELFEFETVDGTALNGYYLKPDGFDANRQYPVLVFQYSGPGSQMVMNGFGGGHHFWHQMLVQQGFVVAVIDPRGTGGRGVEFKKQTYRQLGKLEAEDHIAFGNYLHQQPWVDKDKVGIWGWSYGGYMSSLVKMLGEELFDLAIAVAPVTNWRFYDTIYTERYLGLPQENRSGYDDNSPNSHADKMQGGFLLIHGTGDDNVHFQNAVALQDELIEAGKLFDTFVYPDRAHGISRRGARTHIYRLMTKYLADSFGMEAMVE